MNPSILLLLIVTILPLVHSSWNKCPTFTSKEIQESLQLEWDQQKTEKRDPETFILSEQTKEMIKHYYTKKNSKKNFKSTETNSKIGFNTIKYPNLKTITDFGDVLPPLDQIETECVTLQIPVDHNGSQTTIDYFVKKYHALNGQAKRSLVLLQGGPGSSGSFMEVIALNMMTILPDCDFYIPDHRGTGRSSRLGCSYETEDGLYLSDLDDCVIEINEIYESIGYFSTTNAAKDIKFMLDWIGGDNPVSIYGVSYGTYLVNRFLQLYPTLADTIVLDGICGPGKCFLNDVSSYSEGLKNFLASCDANSFCTSKFENNATDFYLNLVKRVQEKNHCFLAGGFSPVEDYIDSTYLYPVTMPLIYRLNRCGLTDLGWIEEVGNALSDYEYQFYTDTEEPEFPAPDADSDLLFDLIYYSELYLADYDGSKDPYFPQDTSEEISNRKYFLNYIYTDPLAQKFPTFTKNASKILLLNGDFDSRTPASWARHYHQNLELPHHYVEFHGAAHGTTFSSSNPTIGSHTCATQLIASVMNDESINPNEHTCLSQVVDPDDSVFSESGTKNWSEKYSFSLGIWEGGKLPTLFWYIFTAIVIIILILSTCIICCACHCQKKSHPVIYLMEDISSSL